MNANDLPLAQKLAALMEAGRAAHPNVSHVRGVWGDGQTQGCAMTFAALGAGLSDLRARGLVERLAETMGATAAELEMLARQVVYMNDHRAASMDEIIAAVREERLPVVPPRAWDEMNEFYAKLLHEAMLFKPISFTHVYVDESWSVKVEKVEGPKEPRTPKPEALRVNSKTGASWPKPKHAYA